ncbi:cell division protein FtsQ/DivIB [Aquibacillus kalidii]|uniref:cell division protein FtsQ/DivIB n=1 Tax=Aquibacillus kalidii TaxID=2762597 RepID=UPI0016457D0F|nr:FtsQ-type POTRA domain-containing protein [Aquibacillus kalidii]
MSQKNVVSIEDRIPKLKQARKKKANRRLIFYLSIFFTLIFIVIYLQSSLSHVHEVKVSGNYYLEDKAIRDLSEITSEDNFWSVNIKQVKKQIEKHPEIKSVTVSKTFPTTINVAVKEYHIVGYVKQDGKYYQLLENGTRLDSKPLTSLKGDAPLITNFEKDTYLQELTIELERLPRTVVAIVSEIQWNPTEGNPYKIRVYMNDGFEVDASIRNFAKAIRAYPSIVSQLDPKSEGIIRIGDGGAVFDPYDKEVTEPKESQNEIQG